MPKGMGYSHRFWYRKKKLLAERGYSWKTPAEENPHIRFDQKNKSGGKKGIWRNHITMQCRNNKKVIIKEKVAP